MTRARRALPLALVLALAAAWPSAAGAATRIVVAREPGLSAGERGALRAGAGVRYAARAALADGEVVSAPDARADAALRALNADPDVRFAIPDGRLRVTTDDARWPEQWGLNAANDVDINAPEAWTLSTGRGVSVAVIDTGVDATHPDLAGKVRSDGVSYVGTGGPAIDPVGHGTHVAGVIAATRNNGQGIAGAAPDASILPLRVFDAAGSGSSANVLAAFERAGSAGVRVVSGSFSTDPVTDPGDAAAYERAFDTTFARYPNTVFVVAAGNAAPGAPANDDDVAPVFPCSARADNLICVGANTSADRILATSNYGGDSVDVFAPGEGILSTAPGGLYTPDSGTSMAAPFVAAEAALLVSRVPRLDGLAVKDVITSTAHRTDRYTDRAVSGGRADAYAALLEAVRDTDGDGVQDVIDDCPTLAATGANGCVPAVAPTPTPAPVATATPAATAIPGGGATVDGTVGAAVPRMRSLTARQTACRAGRTCRRTATVSVKPDRSAKLTLTVDRRDCPKGRRCRWTRVLDRALTASVRGTSVSVTGRGRHSLKPGTYRVVAVLTVGRFRSKPITRTFRVR